MSRSELPPSSFDGDKDFYDEGTWSKIGRKFKEEPLVPLGCAATCYALFQATKSIRAGDHQKTNRMFRARIYAQAFTLLAVTAGGMYYKEDRAKRGEYLKALEEKKAQEKRDAWLRELEARDKEDREWRERHRKIDKSSANPAAAQKASAEERVARAQTTGKVAKAKVEDAAAGAAEQGQTALQDAVDAVSSDQNTSTEDSKEKGGILDSVKGIWKK